MLTSVTLTPSPPVRQSRPAQVPVHETFDGPMIDPLIWHGNDSPGVVGTSDLEIRRAIVNGQLQLKLTSYGKTDSNVGQTGFASNRLRLNNPALLTQLRARVTVQQAVAQSCPANTTGSSQPQARLVAAFFNDGSSTGAGDQTGDVQANL